MMRKRRGEQAGNGHNKANDLIAGRNAKTNYIGDLEDARGKGSFKGLGKKTSLQEALAFVGRNKGKLGIAALLAAGAGVSIPLALRGRGKNER